LQNTELFLSFYKAYVQLSYKRVGIAYFFSKLFTYYIK
jgi:hypothetical protein